MRPLKHLGAVVLADKNGWHGIYEGRGVELLDCDLKFSQYLLRKR